MEIPKIEEMLVTPSTDENIGFTIILEAGVAIHLQSDLKEGADIENLPLIINKDLSVGTEVITNVFGRYQKGVVCTWDNGDLYVDAGPNITNLDFDKDSRHCWTTNSALNKKAIQIVR